MGCYGILPIVKALMLLVVSFFVLLGVTKTDSKNLKQFGRILAIILMTISAYVFIASFAVDLLGKQCPFNYKMQMMRHRMQYR